MKIRLLAVGERMPAWVDAGFAEYCKRLPPDFSLQLQSVPLAQRGKNSNIEQCVKKESEALLQQLGRNDFIVALEVGGKALNTRSLADRLGRIRDAGQHLSLLVGGPDGLGPECRQRAHEQWSLSPLTLPHTLVRIVVAEQIYRAWTLLQGHPYHRD